MEVHLVDGTYELFRHHFALPSHITNEGIEVAAVRGVLTSMMSLLSRMQPILELPIALLVFQKRNV